MAALKRFEKKKVFDRRTGGKWNFFQFDHN